MHAREKLQATSIVSFWIFASDVKHVRREQLWQKKIIRRHHYSDYISQLQQWVLIYFFIDVRTCLGALRLAVHMRDGCPQRERGWHEVSIIKQCFNGFIFCLVQPTMHRQMWPKKYAKTYKRVPYCLFLISIPLSVWQPCIIPYTLYPCVHLPLLSPHSSCNNSSSSREVSACRT